MNIPITMLLSPFAVFHLIVTLLILKYIIQAIMNGKK